MLNLANNIDPNNFSDPTAVHNIWWRRGESNLGETGSTTRGAKNDSDAVSIDSKSIVEYLFLCLHRLSRAKIGTWVCVLIYTRNATSLFYFRLFFLKPQSVRLFARIAALLSKLCIALPQDFEIPADFVQQIESLLPSVRRLWSTALARNPVRPEVTALVRNCKGAVGKRKFLLRRVK